MVEVKSKVHDNLFHLAIVYACNSGSDRRILWSCLKDKIIDEDPWAIIGDFNITRIENQRSPESDITQDMIDFNECIRDIGCVKPTNSGNLFTWSSTRGDEQIGRSRIDRGLINSTWAAKFPRSHVHILNPGISDHYPLKLYWEKKKRVKRPFKFFNFWMDNDKFKDILHEVWNTRVDGSNMFRVSEKLRLLKNRLTKFDRKKFSNISKRVMTARDDLEEVQYRFLHEDIDDLLQDEEEFVLASFRELSSMEESFIRQKSRQKWDSGDFVHGHEQIQNLAVQFYRGLMGTNIRQHLSHLNTLYQIVDKRISAEDSWDLIKVVSRDEVRKALASINDKSAAFYGGVDDETKARIQDIIGISEGSLLVRYLGIPLTTRQIQVIHYRSLIEKVKNVIIGWAAKKLSYAGIIELVGSVVMGLIGYWSQQIVLPKKVMKEMDTIIRNFIWGSQGRGGKKVKWTDICKPKDEGDIGQRSCVEWNRAVTYKHL
ncbi:uncharacterized protein LOC124943524 [Impatiens glandulifera]|uniref:uncharacterized protein LOC124943524 n=1 Tax=Impatiens glandulifera TaxID=253017 RepID=UPI001FB0C5B7|nr:uncharacterized protein LOC124943524 [Impatiens glandulifera]